MRVIGIPFVVGALGTVLRLKELGIREIIKTPVYSQGCSRGVMVKELDCGIVETEFELQSHYYVHFRANTFGNGMNPFILLFF